MSRVSNLSELSLRIRSFAFQAKHRPGTSPDKNVHAEKPFLLRLGLDQVGPDGKRNKVRRFVTVRNMICDSFNQLSAKCVYGVGAVRIIWYATIIDSISGRVDYQIALGYFHPIVQTGSYRIRN